MAIAEKLAIIEANIPKVYEAGYEKGKLESGGGSGEEFIGIKLSDFTHASYQLPQKAELVFIPEVSGTSIKSSNDRFAHFFRNNNANANGGFYTYLKEVNIPIKIIGFSTGMFAMCGNLTTINGDFTSVVSIGLQTFYQCRSLENIPYMPNLEIINSNSFQNCTGLKVYKFYKKLTSTATNAFSGCTNLLDIYVPWSEGEVENAPWGATNATIHYNTVYDENHNPIVQEA